MLRLRPIVLAMSIAFSAHAQPPQKPAEPAKSADAAKAVNPFFAASTLQYQAPPFDKIKDSDYAPAFDEGMKLQIAEVETIANQSAAPTFDNTIVALERTGQTLTRVSKVFFALAQANTNDDIQKIQEDYAPKLAAHQDAIFLNGKLYARVKKLYEGRAALGLDAESSRLLDRYHLAFVRAGAELSAADQTKLKDLNKEESSLQTAFQQKLLAATKAGALVVDDKAQLKGYNDGDLAAALEAGKNRKLDGKYVVALQNTTQQPAQESLADRATREKLFKASIDRAEHGDGNDTRATIQRLAELRVQKANLLGFKTWADYGLADQMAKKPENAIKLMTDIVPMAVAKAKDEAAGMQKLVDEQKGGFKLAPWDWQYYSEQVRKKNYDLDQNEIKQYFELDSVLQNGVFFAANKLYGVTFKERHDLPVYQPDVRVFEMFDTDGKSMALFYADYFKRDNKSGGAWMDSFVDQNNLLGTRPVVFNVCNFTKPAPGQPALISHDDAITMFHEFGHALHGLFSNVKYPYLAGTNVPRDFVEFPSQFNEHWADEPSVFANYAKHYKTGAPMPAELVAKIKKAGTYGQGFATTEYLGAALLDQAWHSLPKDSTKQDVDKFETAALTRYHVDYALVPPRYRTSYFAHIWGGGYSAGYYAYLWTAVLRDDAYYWFKEHGGMTRENGQRFRDMVLSRGGTEETDALYRAWRGRDPSVEPLLEVRGLKPAKADKSK
ncbi:MAG: peptidyl-dipeptidase Dcp [Rudaea sp.]|uniref:peptidyl-dipeptidase Dcp n=1 Tax=unclassified Rudaea TaxID=2627037 RepID=UPI0010FA15B5|nr:MULTISPECIES: peptidyl-dipeptidase Dcp [unclassified Rudaea]MBN8887051.1 peptidyl-dipeptidase Dcp [Rudaea sp.]